MYFRTRAAYHLYPHNVFVERASLAEPTLASSLVKPGEYVVAYLRHNMQYDPTRQLLRWDGLTPLHAEALLSDRGNWLFKVLP